MPDPAPYARELPFGIAGDCALQTPCHGMREYLAHWVSKTQSGNLYLVSREACADAGRCTAWFVEETPQGYITRLTVDGIFRVVRNGQPYPDVQIRRDVSDVQSTYTQFSWVAGKYVETGTREVFRVNGVECGTDSECHQEALRAYRNRESERALKIWETVHKLSWI